MENIVGQKYERLNKIGVGYNQPMVFNTFKVISINSKNVLILGTIASGLERYRNIQIKDFDIFVKKYKIV